LVKMLSRFSHYMTNPLHKVRVSHVPQLHMYFFMHDKAVERQGPCDCDSTGAVYAL
jgi:hypothetical protein